MFFLPISRRLGVQLFRTVRGRSTSPIADITQRSNEFQRSAKAQRTKMLPYCQPLLPTVIAVIVYLQLVCRVTLTSEAGSENLVTTLYEGVDFSVPNSYKQLNMAEYSGRGVRLRLPYTLVEFSKFQTFVESCSGIPDNPR